MMAESILFTMDILTSSVKNNQNIYQPSWWKKISNGIIVNTLRNETLEPQANGHLEDLERFVDSASQNQVIGSNNYDRMRDAVDSAVIVFEYPLHDAILTAMTDVVIPRVEMAIKSVTGSSRNGPYSRVQNLDRRDFTGNNENTPLRLASSRLDLNIEQGEINDKWFW